MDEVFQEIVADDPALSHYFAVNYRDTPIPHFWSRPPKYEVIDLNATNPTLNMHPDKDAFVNHLLNYRYSDVKGVVTQRGYSTKWQISIDLLTGETIEENQEGTYPWREFYNALELKNIWHHELRPRVYNTWFPTLYPGGNLLAKKLRVTYIRDTISRKDQFQHPLERSESNVLLSVHAHIYSPAATWINLKYGDDVQNRTLAYPGAGIVTSPQRHPHEYRVFTSDMYGIDDTFSKDVINDTYTMYLKFDFIE